MNIVKSKTVEQICEITDVCYSRGWDERNGGNISVIIDEQELLQELTNMKSKSTITLEANAHELVGKYIIVTGSGTYFRNISKYPEDTLGILYIKNAQTADIVWGFDNCKPTSEFPTHLLAHSTRLKVDKKHLVVIHSHPTNTVAMTSVHPLESKSFTVSLWKMHSEGVIVFPDGVGVLEWMICGNQEIGIKSAELLLDRRIVIWVHHGIFGTGNSIQETFGLIETVEKAAEIYMKTVDKSTFQYISKAQLKSLAKAFKITPREGYLD